MLYEEEEGPAGCWFLEGGVHHLEATGLGHRPIIPTSAPRLPKGKELEASAETKRGKEGGKNVQLGLE